MELTGIWVEVDVRVGIKVWWGSVCCSVRDCVPAENEMVCAAVGIQMGGGKWGAYFSDFGLLERLESTSIISSLALRGKVYRRTRWFNIS